MWHLRRLNWMVGVGGCFAEATFQRKSNGKQSESALLARQEQFHKVYHIHKIYRGSAGPTCL